MIVTPSQRRFPAVLLATALVVALFCAGGVSAQKAGVRQDPGGPELLQKDEGEHVAPRLPSDSEGTIRVLGLLRVEDSRGGFAILEQAGAAGMLIDEMGSAGIMQKAPIYRFWGRVKETASVSKFATKIAETRRIQTLWLAWVEVPATGTDPVPLTTVVWSPLLYPSRASTLTRGPGGNKRYYYEPGSSAVLESTNDGRSFETAFTAARTSEFVDGGGGWDLTKIFWKAKVASWVEKQEDLRETGYRKYGPLLEPDTAPPLTPSP